MKVPTIEDAGVPEVFGVIAEKLFGEDAFRDPHVARPILKEEINKMISSFLAKLWHNMRNTVSTQYDRLNQGTKSAQDAYMSTHELQSLRGRDVTERTIPQNWIASGQGNVWIQTTSRSGSKQLTRSKSSPRDSTMTMPSSSWMRTCRG